MGDSDGTVPADAPTQPPSEVAPSSLDDPPRRPRHSIVLTVILSVLVLGGIVAMIAFSSAGEANIGGANATLRDADLSLPSASTGAAGAQTRAKIAEQMRRLLRAEKSLPPNVATAARVLLVIVLVEDDKPDDARTTLATLSPPALSGLLRCAFPTLGTCDGPSPEPAVLAGALSVIGGERSEAAGLIRRGLAQTAAGPETDRPTKAAFTETPAPWWRQVPPALLIVAAVITTLVLRRARRGRGGAPRPPMPPAPWSAWGFWSALVRWLTASTAVLLVGAIPIVVATVRGSAPGTFPTWGAALYEACGVWLVAPFFLRPWGLTFRTAFGFSRGSLDAWSVLANALSTAALAVVGGQLLSLAIQYLDVPGAGFVESQGISATEGVLAWLTTIAYAVVGAPLLEEMVFRGLLFGALRPRLGQVLAALVSAALFAASHPYGWPGRIMVGFYALAFSWRYVRSGSLLPGMLAHALLNVVAILQVAG